jgi:hypothetical protein
MKRLALSRFFLRAALAFVLLLFGSTSPAQDSDWSEWKSAPNFPGIKIRVLCGTYLPSTGNASWHFQFLNAYTKRVALTYEEESSRSTGHPPTFSSPGLDHLDPGEKSPQLTTILRGSCESRKRIYIRVVSIADEQGNKMRPRAGSSQSGGFGSSSERTNSASTSIQRKSSGGTQITAAAGAPENTQVGTAPQNHSSTTASRPADDLAGAWDCTETESYSWTSQEAVLRHYTAIFNKDGSWRFKDDNDSFHWTVSGSALSLEQPTYGKPATGQIVDSSHFFWSVSRDPMEGTSQAGNTETSKTTCERVPD